jgi:NAD(P)-dependent dehydrogenase (short-subunit alcohol dehydrogenase family)
MKQKGIVPTWGPGRHGPGNNPFAYFVLAHSGFVIEFTSELQQIDEATHEAQVWSRDDPEAMDRWMTAGPPTSAQRASCRAGPIPASRAAQRHEAERRDERDLRGQGGCRHRRLVGHRPRHGAAPLEPKARGGVLRPQRGTAADVAGVLQRDHGESRVYAAALLRARCRRRAALRGRGRGAFRRCDLLVNNAGQGGQSTFADTADDDWRAEYELKLFSQIHPIRAFLPMLRASKGAIVAVNSLLAYQPEPHMVCTSSARAGVQNLLKSLSVELAPEVRVNSVLLGLVGVGAVDPPLRRAPRQESVSRADWYGARANKGIPLGRLGEPDRGRCRHRLPRLAGGQLHHRRAARGLGRPVAAYLRDHGKASCRDHPAEMPAPAPRAPRRSAIHRPLPGRYRRDVAFGVISIHNMPILDADRPAGPHPLRARPRRGRSDEHGRCLGPGVGRPGRLLHLDRHGRRQRRRRAGRGADGRHRRSCTSPPGRPGFMDRDRAAIHDVPRQPDMLRAVSKAYVRMWDANGAIGALTARSRRRSARPPGRSALEIPVDVQRSPAPRPARIHAPQPPGRGRRRDRRDGRAVRAARRPMLWLGGGARGAQAEATALVRAASAPSPRPTAAPWSPRTTPPASAPST